METKKREYTAEQIKVLHGLEGVRKRPAMYIGSTGKDGLHHLVYEVVDNSIDEALVGFCTKINVKITKKGSVIVKDNGRGIPVEEHKQTKKSALETVMTMLHAGGKFDKKAYLISGGLHGVGISVVNALSKKLIVKVRRNGKIYQQEYSRGKSKTSLKVVGETGETGTESEFFPDEEIFSTLKFDFEILKTRFRELSFLNPGLTIILEDENKNKKEKFFSGGGIEEFVKWLNETRTPCHKPIYFKKQDDGTYIEVAIQYNDSYIDNILGFVNTINTVEGGTHIVGFKTAITRVINDYAKKNNHLKGNINITGNDVREGLTAIISIKIREPQFEGQTKTKLGNSEIKGLVDSTVSLFLSEFFQENPKIAKKIIDKVSSAANARAAAKKARDLIRRKSALSISNLPGKLADCSSKKREQSELYIVEGDSAGGCFSGNTRIALADGRNLSFKNLVEEYKQGIDNFCYTIKQNGSVGIAKINNPRITKKNVQVIKVILDNDKEIICTPDHKFMLRDGSYKEAQHLTKKDSLMPFHRRISKMGGRITIEGYEMVWDQNKIWVFTHLLSDEYNLKNNIYSLNQGNHKHHIDFNKLNNNPTNIIRIPKEKHLILHTEHLEKTLHRKDVKEKAKKAHQKEEYRKKISKWAKQPKIKEMLSKRAKKLWENEEYKEFMIRKFKEFYNSNVEYQEKNKKILDEQQKKYWSNLKNRKKASEKVKRFFQENPDAKEYLSNLAKEQWKDELLLIWRRQKTREQWTPEFREKRKIAYNKTYYEKTIKLMKDIIERNGNLNKFDEIRIKNRDNSILSMKTFCSRFFGDNYEEMFESIKNYNHKIKKIEWLTEKINVYDLEVEETHNFALDSGIFVHNSAKQARNKEFQAILPLKGKILNVEKANPHKIFSNNEIAALISAIGSGVGEQFNLDKLRYHKVIIMTDADVDGAHIKTLLLTFFFRYMKELIENGNIFAAVPPLYRIKKGQRVYYVYDDKELKKLKDKIGQSVSIQRFKGLGEMNPDQLWETTMNPKTRLLKKITIEDAALADNIFSTLMGDKVEPRREFIENHAHEAEVDV